jgi:hypothetical protein
VKVEQAEGEKKGREGRDRYRKIENESEEKDTI